MPARRTTVMIRYTHPLLGEGIARLLAAEQNLDIVLIDAADLDAVARALALAPDVIIFERGDPDRAVEVLGSAPEALLIDVGIDAGPTFTYRRTEIPARPERIVELIRDLRVGDSTASAPPRPVPLAQRAG